MFAYLKSLFTQKPIEKVVEEKQDFVFPVDTSPKTLQTPVKTWKVGMWVTVTDKNVTGVIGGFKDDSIEFHLVSPTTGETTSVFPVSFNGVRQAKYSEIPGCRMGVSQDVARELGYGD